MAGQRTLGSVGAREWNRAIDPGTLARRRSPLPGPIGFRGHHTVPTRSSVAPAFQQGITVNPASKLSAQDWRSKLMASDDVPDLVKNHIKAKDNLIFLSDIKRLRWPTDRIPSDWFPHWLYAFKVAEWEITTSYLEISVKKGDTKGPFLMGELKPDLSSGESIERVTAAAGLVIKSRSVADFAVEYGDTMSSGTNLIRMGANLNSGRKLIAISTKVVLSLENKVKQDFDLTDSEILNAWFHEIGCHAGRDSEHETSTHGDPDVEACAAEVDKMIPNRVTTSKIFAEIDRFLKP